MSQFSRFEDPIFRVMPINDIALRRVEPALRVVGDDGQVFEMTIEDVKAWMSQPRHPSGSKKGGQWSGGPSQSNYGPQMPAGSPGGGGGGGVKKDDAFGNFILPDVAKGVETRQGPQSSLVTGSNFSQEEEWGVDAYTKVAYVRVNGHLRGQVKADAADLATIARLDSAMSKTRLSEDMTLVRGIDRSGMSALFDKFGGEIQPGDKFTDPSYVSTTRDVRTSKEFAGLIGASPAYAGYVMSISVKRGSPILPVAMVAKNAHTEREDEFLLPRGSSFTVRAIDAKARTLYVEMD